MSKFHQQLMGLAASRLADQIWSIRDTSLQAYLGAHVSGAVARLTPERSLTHEVQGAVAIFRVEGMIVPKAEWAGEVGSIALATAIQAATRSEDIRAGIFLIDSPGGVCHGMHELVQAAAEFAAEKSLTAHVNGCCCSCAYELASQANKIYAGPRDDIGSIGTRSLIYDFSKYYTELGIEAVSTDTGPIKSLGVPGTPVTDEQRAFLQRRVDYLQADFQSAVMNGRGMTAEQFATIATGEYWFGEQALSLGLIDGIQNYQQTFAGVESAFSKTVETVGSNPMAEAITNEPKSVTTAELKKTFPKSSAEWREEQTEAKATMADAAVAYAQFQEEQAEKAQAAQAEAEAKTEAAEKKADEAAGAPPTKKKGHAPVASGGSDEDTVGDIDFRAEAIEY